MSNSTIVSQPAMGRATSPRYARAVQLLAAILLTAAAILKAYQAVRKPDVLPMSSRLFDAALIEYELAVAAMLVLNVLPMAAWGIAVTTFTIFAGVSVRKWLGGASSCGCFGPVVMDPRVTSVIDLVMLVALLMTGPRLSRVRGRHVSRTAAATFLFLMLACSAAITYAAFPKQGLVAQNADYDFGLLPADQTERCEHIFILRNTSSRAIHITGWQSSCGCTVAQVPTTPIAPGEVTEVNVRANWSNVNEGSPYARVTLATDNVWTPSVPVVIHAQIAQPTSAPATRASE